MGYGPPLKGKRMKFSEIIVNILAKKQKKPASAIYTKYGPALEAADEAYQQELGKVSLDFHKEAENALNCAGNAEKAVMPEPEPTHFSQPTKFSSESARTGYISCLQSNLAEHRKDMARLWEERGEVERSFQARIDHESQQIELLEARIHLTHNTPVEGGEIIPGPIHCATPFLKGGY